MVYCLTECTANQTEFTPLYIAAQNGHLEVVKYLITLGLVVDSPNKVSDVTDL